ncbi:MAG: hypothetical protein ACYCR7_03220 [Thermoplasmataceae archaeon]
MKLLSYVDAVKLLLSEGFSILSIRLGYMTIVHGKINARGGSRYNKLVCVKQVNGKVVQKYVGYL